MNHGSTNLKPHLDSRNAQTTGLNSALKVERSLVFERMVVLQNVSPPREGVRHEEVDITAVLDGKRLGAGTLCVAESRVSWVDGSGIGFSLDYPSISLHAISRDLSAYPAEHLYVQVNSKHEEDSKDTEVKAKEEADGSVDDDEDDDDLSAGAFTEIRFVPNDKVENMFIAMSECQALHPDPDDSDSDFDGDEYDVEEAEQGQIDLPTYSFEEGMSQLTMEGQATLDRLEGIEGQSSAPQCCMAGVRTGDAEAALNGSMHFYNIEANLCDEESKTDSGALGVSGQFDDAEVDHCT
ncbi:methylosome subunit pICln-like isoform X4 [Tachysurus vachellii]|uniref:methylosome subunit pICln-like isoform X4 n=1 Tax=Tachysurus vachellii TaxID=175792 RepID=UPI00296AF0B7|nr:methylosome subunit pICln-like isoform X4 [Tachysurus vachellii]